MVLLNFHRLLTDKDPFSLMYWNIGHFDMKKKKKKIEPSKTNTLIKFETVPKMKASSIFDWLKRWTRVNLKNMLKKVET